MDPCDRVPGSTELIVSVGLLAVLVCSDRRLADHPGGPHPAADRLGRVCVGLVSAGRLGWDCLLGSSVAPLPPHKWER